MITVGLVNLGCAKNQVDAEIMLGLIAEAGFKLVDDYSQAEVLIINTCGFIGDAKEESIDTILQLAEYKQNNCKSLIVTGCLAQRYLEELEAEIPEIDGILGTGNFDQIVEVIEETLSGKSRAEVGNPEFNYHNKLPQKRIGQDYTAYLKIAEGCNNCCSYCVIPDLRGKLHSREIEDIVTEAVELAEQGVKEVNIIAQDVTKYGSDLYGEPKLVELLTELMKVKGIKWFRLLYAYPNDLSDELIGVMAKYERICNYIDLPIQHVDDKIRKKMRRRGNKKEILALVQKLRDRIPGISIRTSLIVGFPGETEEEFENLLDFVQQARFDRLGVFPYSREEGTAAAEMPNQVAEEIKEERYERIMDLQQRISLERNQEWVGRKVEVLIEEIQQNGDKKLAVGRTQRDAPEVDGLVYVKEGKAEPGEFITVRIKDAYEYDLIGERVE